MPDYTKHWTPRQYLSEDLTISLTVCATNAVICTPAGDLVLPIAVYEALSALECEAAQDKLRQAIVHRRTIEARENRPS